MDSQSFILTPYPILITRPRQETCALSDGLQEAGAKILLWPLIETRPIPFTLSTTDKIEKEVGKYQGLFFSSQNAVQSFFANEAARQWGTAHVEAYYAVGSETAELVNAYVLANVCVPKTFDAMSAVRQWFDEGIWKPGDAILWPCGNLANSELLSWAESQRVKLDPLPVYETRTVTLSLNEKKALQADAEYASCWVFSSPSAIEAFVSFVDVSRSKATVACLGARTAETAKRLLGRCEIIAKTNTMAGLCQQIIEHYSLKAD